MQAPFDDRNQLLHRAPPQAGLFIELSAGDIGEQTGLIATAALDMLVMRCAKKFKPTKLSIRFCVSEERKIVDPSPPNLFCYRYCSCYLRDPTPGSDAIRRDSVSFARAIDHWERDLVLLREKYYFDFFHFGWPATHPFTKSLRKYYCNCPGANW